jgi:hypothetical protein
MGFFAKAGLTFMFLLFNLTAYNQTRENGGWFFLSHTQKLTDKFDLLADVQLRSANHYDYLSTLLLRGALQYHLNDHHAVAAGYAYKGDWEEEQEDKQYKFENRIYEQYAYEFKLKKTEMMVRARLEQRFIKEEATVFSQRGRILISAQVPLIANSDFTKGLYGNLQDELFMNLQNKDKVNHSFLDQNRPFISLGYRWSKKIDTEIGYMQWLQREDDGDYRRNIVQLMVTTNL